MAKEGGESSDMADDNDDFDEYAAWHEADGVDRAKKVEVELEKIRLPETEPVK